VDVLIRGYEHRDGSIDDIRSDNLDPAVKVWKSWKCHNPWWIWLGQVQKGKRRAGVSDYQIDNSKLTTHCAPPCKTCRRGVRLTLDLISETTVVDGLVYRMGRRRQAFHLLLLPTRLSSLTRPRLRACMCLCVCLSAFASLGVVAFQPYIFDKPTSPDVEICCYSGLLEWDDDSPSQLSSPCRQTTVEISYGRACQS